MTSIAGTATGTATITGGTFSTGRNLYVGSSAGNSTVVSTLNITGGTVTAAAINSASASLATVNIGPAATLTSKLWTTGAGNTFLNLNGGTVKAGITGSLLGASAASSAAIVLYGTGGTIDANGVAITLFSPISTATGSAVTGLTVGTADSTTVFSAPPSLAFSGGGGSGGSGYATLDGSGHINGVVITNGGSYASAPTVTVAGSGTETLTAAITSSVNAPLNLTAAGTTITMSGANTTATGPINIPRRHRKERHRDGLRVGRNARCLRHLWRHARFEWHRD